MGSRNAKMKTAIHCLIIALGIFSALTETATAGSTKTNLNVSVTVLPTSLVSFKSSAPSIESASQLGKSGNPHEYVTVKTTKGSTYRASITPLHNFENESDRLGAAIITINW